MSGRVTAVRGAGSATGLQLTVDQGTRADWRGMSGAAVRRGAQGEGGEVIGLITQVTEDAATAWATPATALRRLLDLAHAADVLAACRGWAAHPQPPL